MNLHNVHIRKLAEMVLQKHQTSNLGKEKCAYQRWKIFSANFESLARISRHVQHRKSEKKFRYYFLFLELLIIIFLCILFSVECCKRNKYI